MVFLSPQSARELHRYHRVVTRFADVRSHLDLLVWLQGDMQRYLPHDILIVSWGSFSTGRLHHDIISPMEGVRSRNLDPDSLGCLIRAFHERWREFDNKIFSVEAGTDGFQSTVAPANANPVSEALATMRNAIVHGFLDARGNQDCLYTAFSKHVFGERDRAAWITSLPYIDNALRQIEHLPQQARPAGHAEPADDKDDVVADALMESTQDHNLSDRESQILYWVAMGKTNPEIASILHISSFTVKNHMQRVFKKLDVTNRAQAVNKFRPQTQSAQT